ncbi:MAG: hypothetical protein A2202_07435 [Bdellovibrionales bacterium RIFOXYA1_FULL_36_14]|nr:MAG: hypothetical protein A2202_07435 [Bdellovibrionales bacterium RIFOXYA1_FULL_36_14]
MISRLIILFFITFLINTSFDFSVYASEESIYKFSWLDPDKEVYVLQNRKFRKAGKFHFNAGYAHLVSGAFVDGAGLQGRAGYFFTEDWGFEVLYTKTSSKENDTAAAVRHQVGGGGSYPFSRMVDGYVGGMILWSPFYAKFNTFNQVLYLDWILGLGYSKLDETNNRDELSGITPFVLTKETHGCILWDLAFKFYLTESWNIRTDLTVQHYQAQKPIQNSTPSDKSWYSNYDFVVSLGFNI